MAVTVTAVEGAEAAKARGAFYTPSEITRFLSLWAVRGSSDTVLEPSAGDGAFLLAVAERFADLSPERRAGRIVGIEREGLEAEKSRQLVPDAEVREADFFDLDPDVAGRFTAVIGNPPYVRYHGFRGIDRSKALARAEAQGIQLTGLASSWAHFVVHASAFVEDGGRLALVLPAELLHTDYAAPVRTLLARRFQSVTVVAFDRAAFRTAQVDAVLLLASNDEPKGFRVIRVRDVEALIALDIAIGPTARVAPNRWSGSVDREAGDIYEEVIAGGAATSLGTFAHVDIGFVSGANDFFVLSPDVAAERGIPKHLLTPAVRRPSDVPGLYLRGGDARWLLNLAGNPELDAATRRYLETGVRSGISQRYKCRSRTPWYAVPLPKRMPDAFLPYMMHLGPRLIVNTKGARNSNLLHGVALKEGAPPAAALAVAMASSLTLLSAEIEGRAYGGGVLKLETKEAERLLVPGFSKPEDLISLLPDVDELVRTGKIEHASLSVDQLLGLPHTALWTAYQTMRNRRLNRR